MFRFEGTLERFTGDGLMVFFNDPLPCDDAAERAIAWPSPCAPGCTTSPRMVASGHDLGFGIGVAQGYATLGRIGFEGRYDYAAVGSVTNLAARLCAHAADDQILVTQRVLTATEHIAVSEPFGELELPGLARPVRAFNITCLLHDHS